MKIAYIILTCEKYFTTRVKYQLNTFLKYVAKEDVYYLTSKMDEQNRQFGWGAADDYNSLPDKVIDFFKNMNIDYDWYFFLDDDTFVFVNRLKDLLSVYNTNRNIYLGKKRNHIKNEWSTYMSGGAGYILSNSLYKSLIKYVRETPIEKIKLHTCIDLCKGIWIHEIGKTQKVVAISNDAFHHENHNNNENCREDYKKELELEVAITFHQVRDEQLFNFYNNILNKESTVFVTLTNYAYLNRAKKTIKQIRNNGLWDGKIILITTDFDLDEEFKLECKITEKKFPLIDKSEMISKIGNGFSDGDRREITKITQWEKLHLFDEYFANWERVIFLDAGISVLDSVQNLLDLEFRNYFLCGNDNGDSEIRYGNKVFDCQLTKDRPDVKYALTLEFGTEMLNSEYFLNCMWVYDTEILKKVKKQDFVDVMNKYPLFRTNEMGVMNVLLHFKHKLWKGFPEKAQNGKYLFDWCESNRPGTQWYNYCFIKYANTHWY
jgi:hypothetical protein